MNTHTKIAFKFTIITVAALSLAATAHAGERFRGGWFATRRGGSGTFQQQINRQPGQYSRDTSIQTAGGRSASRSTTDTWDRQSGTADRSVVTTGPNRRTATVNESATHSGNTTTVSGSRTGFDGQTSSWNKTVTTGGGTMAASGEYTRQNGNTISTSSTVTQTAAGRQLNGSYETSTGKSGSYTENVIHAGDIRVRTENVTGSDGRSIRRMVESTPDGTTIVRLDQP